MGIGVHGFGGNYLVNGKANGIVTLEIEPTARAFVIGIPVSCASSRSHSMSLSSSSLASVLKTFATIEMPPRVPSLEPVRSHLLLAR